jgi:pimeloyl-ACP methyl ester carboxylesterase
MKKDRAHFFAGFFKDFYGVGLVSQPVSDEVLAWSRNVSMQAGLKATLDCAKAFATTDFRPDLAAFKVPTLIIHGTADQTVPIDATGRAAARGIAQAKLIEYEGAPHGLFATHKERLTNDLLAFLGQSAGHASGGGR